MLVNNKSYKRANYFKWLFDDIQNVDLKDWAIAFGVSLLISCVFVVSISQYMASGIEREQKAFAGRVLAHTSNVEQEVEYIFSVMNSASYKRCSIENLTEMRQQLFNADYVKNIAFIKNGRLLCSTAKRDFKSNAPFLLEGGYKKPNGMVVWPKASISIFGKILDFTVFQKGNYVAFYDYSKTYEVIPGKFEWVITHNFKKEPHYFSGKKNAKFHEPITDWWSLIKYFVPIYRFCNPRNYQCVDLKIGRSHLFVNQSINFNLLLAAVGLLMIFSMFFSLKFFSWRKSMSQRVLTALRRKEFYCQYQPIVDLKTGQYSGVEVLARLNSRGQNITPDQFIPAIADSGISWEFTKQVVAKAIKELRDITNEYPDFKVAFNVFSNDVENGAVREFSNIAGISDFKGKLVIEITESEYLDGTHAQENLNNLHNAGVGIAIDDFGTGYSNMQQLEKIKCDILKIDRSFVTKISSKTERSPLIEHIVNIGHSSNMKLVAEGIETKEQLSELMALNIEYGQGYMFARPGSAEGLKVLLQSAQKLISNDDNKVAPRHIGRIDVV